MIGTASRARRRKAAILRAHVARRDAESRALTEQLARRAVGRAERQAAARAREAAKINRAWALDRVRNEMVPF